MPRMLHRRATLALLTFALSACGRLRSGSGPAVDVTPTGGAKGGGGVATGVIGPDAASLFDALPQAERDKIKAAKVFFGHQSVGGNILEGAAALGYTFTEVSGAGDYDKPRLGHALVGSNREPLSKIQHFDAMLGKIGAPDVAAMKLCWIDFGPRTDVRKVQSAYVETINGIVGSHPKTHLFHVTPPLTTDDPSLNKARVAYGDWLKNTYKGTAIVLDLGGLESTKPDGSACTEGDARRLCDEYASDEGHLNAAGEARVAKAFLYAVYKSL